MTFIRFVMHIYFISSAMRIQSSAVVNQFRVFVKNKSENFNAFNVIPCGDWRRPSGFIERNHMDSLGNHTKRCLSSLRIMAFFFLCRAVRLYAYTVCALVGRVTHMTQQINTQQIFVIWFCSSVLGKEAERHGHFEREKKSYLLNKTMKVHR